MSGKRARQLRQLALINLLTGGGVQYETPAYANAGGTGDRAALITVTKSGDVWTDGNIAVLIDGNTANDSFYFLTVLVQNRWIQFQFTHAVIINEAKFYTDAAHVAEGTWKWQGSNNGSTWTDVSANFTLGGDANPSIITALSGNTTAYIYYRIEGVSGTASATSWVNEFEFKIGNPL